MENKIEELLKTLMITKSGQVVKKDEYKTNLNITLDEFSPFKKIYDDGSFNISCRCGYLLLQRSYKYCPECGSKLNWQKLV